MARLEALASSRPTWIDEAVHLVRDEVTFRVSSLSHKLGVTPRTLQRGMVEHVGVTPKAFLRVERVRRAAAEIAAGACASAVAAETGFADQAHLIREPRTLLGVSTRGIQVSYGVGFLQAFARGSGPDRSMTHAPTTASMAGSTSSASSARASRSPWPVPSC